MPANPSQETAIKDKGAKDIRTAFQEATGKGHTDQPAKGLDATFAVVLAAAIILLVAFTCFRAVMAKINTEDEINGGKVILAITLSVITIGVVFVFIFLVTLNPS